MKLYRLLDNTIKIMPGSANAQSALNKRNERQQNIISHVWVNDDRIVAGTGLNIFLTAPSKYSPRIGRTPTVRTKWRNENSPPKKSL